ncbi:hypothetical protein GGI07_002599 [Coemansia sp. Benny D115]|nr:hypothetical protein GGI07_002599 [Coemansia sp. Benny D115]
MVRQGGRRPEHYRGAGRDAADSAVLDNDVSGRSDINGRTRTRGGGGRGHGGAKKAVFQPTVRALPTGPHATATTTLLAGDNRDAVEKRKKSGLSGGLLLVNKKLGDTKTISNGVSATVTGGVANGTHSDAAASKAEPAANPWTAWSRPSTAPPATSDTGGDVARSANSRTVPSGGSSALEAPRTMPETVAAREPMPPMPQLEASESGSAKWDEMVDSGIDFMHDTAEKTPSRPQHPAATVDGTKASKPLIDSNPKDTTSAKNVGPSFDSQTQRTTAAAETAAETAAEAAAEETAASTSERHAAPASNHATSPENPPHSDCSDGISNKPVPSATASRTAADIWGKPALKDTASAAAQAPAAQQNARWWKATLSGGTRLPSTSSLPPSTPPASATLNKLEGDSSGRIRQSRATAVENTDGKARRPGGRRQTAPMPTVVPPVLLARASARQRESLMLSSSGGSSRNTVPRSVGSTPAPPAAAATAAKDEPASTEQTITAQPQEPVLQTKAETKAETAAPEQPAKDSSSSAPAVEVPPKRGETVSAADAQISDRNSTKWKSAGDTHQQSDSWRMGLKPPRPQPQQQQQMVPPAMYSPTAADVQKSYAIDVPQRRQAPDAAGYHRDSESSSSVSSQGTLLESYSPQTHQRAFAKHGAEYRPSTRIFAPTQQQHVATAAAIHVQPELAAGAGMCEEDVYAAASILMSLRTCKMPC